MTTARVFPRFGRPRVLVANPQSFSSALTLVAQSSQVSEQCVHVARRLSLGLFHILTRQVQESDRAMFNQQEAKETLHNVFHLPHENINYYIGAPSPRQKVTAQINQQGRVIAYVKIGTLPEAKLLIRQEREILSELQRKGFNDQQFGALIGSHSVDGREVIVMAAPRLELAKRQLSMDMQDVEFVRGLFALSRTAWSFAQYDDRIGLSRRISKICEFPQLRSVRRGLLRSMKILQKFFDARELQTGFCHGDFTPWNTLRQEHGVQYAFDWEYGTTCGPALADLFHFVRSVKHHVLHHHAIRLVAEMFDEQKPEVRIFSDFARLLEIERDALPAYFLLYLLQEILRHAEVQGSVHPALEHYPSQVVQIMYLVSCMNATFDIMQRGMRRRVLVAAYACESDKGSEPAVGWNWVQEISKENEVWVLTKSNNEDSILRSLAQTPNEHLHFEYVELPRWMSFWKKRQRGVRIYYYLWQYAALCRAYSLHRCVAFDVAHHVTFVNDWLWSCLTLLPIPYVWGPIGSHPPYPNNLSCSMRTTFQEMVRLTIQRVCRICDPLYWMTAIRAKHVIAINEQTLNQFPLSRLIRSKSTVSPAIAIAPQEQWTHDKKSRPFRVLFVGRLHYVKCPNLAVESFSRFLEFDRSAELILVGRGPEEQRLRRLVSELSCTENVQFIPWQTRTRVLELMQECDVFLYPSVEGGGFVVLEAMASGLPVLCLDYGGPGAMVDASVGVKIPLSNHQQVVFDLCQALRTIRENPVLMESLSAQAREKADRVFSWTAKGELTNEVYRRVVR